MLNKSIRRNFIPATAIAAGGSLFSQVQSENFARGIRLIIKVSAVTATGTSDSLWLCATDPAVDTGYPATPASSAIIPITGPTAANMLSVAGTYVVDFYPAPELPATGVAAGQLLGLFGIHLPARYAVKITMGAGNAATIAIDAVILP